MSIAARRFSPVPLVLTFVAVCALVWLFAVGKIASAMALDRIPAVLGSSQCQYPQSTQEFGRNLKLAIDGFERQDGGSYFLPAFVMYSACGQRVPELWPDGQ